jgi:outer membrane receptor protein involved in Fe transport
MFPLDRFYTMDLQVGRAITRKVELFAAAENLTDTRYQVARTPIVNIGPPILFRVGLRLISGRRRMCRPLRKGPVIPTEAS